MGPVILCQTVTVHHTQDEIVGHVWPTSSQLSFLFVLLMCGYAFLKAQLATKTEKSCLGTERRWPAGGVQ